MKRGTPQFPTYSEPNKTNLIFFLLLFFFKQLPRLEPKINRRHNSFCSGCYLVGGIFFLKQIQMKHEKTLLQKNLTVQEKPINCILDI